MHFLGVFEALNLAEFLAGKLWQPSPAPVCQGTTRQFSTYSFERKSLRSIGAARRDAENAGVEAEISLSALRYPSFPDMAKQNRGPHAPSTARFPFASSLSSRGRTRPAPDLLLLLPC